MKIYLAGGITGNLISLWKEIIKIYLAGTYSRKDCIKEAMKVYLAGNAPWREAGIYNKAIEKYNPYILESYYYIRNNSEWIMEMRPFMKDFLLDSGAFTFLNEAGNHNWQKYVEEYAAFINKHDVDYFFELDIDPIVGLKEVERLRHLLEKLTGKKCIPVWHKSRGLDYWKKMVQEYDYVSIGGIVTKEIKPKDYPIFGVLIKIANQHKCKVHGLGFTNMDGLRKYKFYSVDSTAWLYGNRGGFLYQFNGTGLDKIQPKNMRLKGRPAAMYNFTEWLKFSHYADRNL